MHVINLHGAKCELRRNVKIESAAEHNGPCRVALARSNPNKAPGAAEKRMSKEQHTATRIKERRTDREIAQAHLRAVLPSQPHRHPKSVYQVNCSIDVECIPHCGLCNSQPS